MSLLIIVVIILAFNTVVFLPDYLYACKVEYLEKQGYIKVEKFIDYTSRIEMYFVKNEKCITETELNELSLRQIKELY